MVAASANGGGFTRKLERLLKAEQERKAAEEHYEKLRSLEEDVAMELADAIFQLDETDASAIPVILELLFSDFGTSEVEGDLRERLLQEVEDSMFAAVHNMGNAALPPLVEALERWPHAPRFILSLVGFIGTAEAVEVLLENFFKPTDRDLQPPAPTKDSFWFEGLGGLDWLSRGGVPFALKLLESEHIEIFYKVRIFEWVKCQAELSERYPPEVRPLWTGSVFAKFRDALKKAGYPKQSLTEISRAARTLPK